MNKDYLFINETILSNKNKVYKVRQYKTNKKTKKQTTEIKDDIQSILILNIVNLQGNIIGKTIQALINYYLLPETLVAGENMIGEKGQQIKYDNKTISILDSSKYIFT